MIFTVMKQGGLDTRHQRYLSSQHFYTRVALRNSETTSWSKVEDVGFHKRPGKCPIRRLASSTTFRLSEQLLLTPQPRFNLGLLAYWTTVSLEGAPVTQVSCCQCVDL